KRPQDEDDGLRWYCENCGEILHEEFFYLTDIVEQLKEAIQNFWNDDEARTCGNCGAYLERD
ncbi:MAG: 3-hydroxyanthranilate 3,4-dioxygenase, partial [Persicimonas sp.]